MVELKTINKALLRDTLDYHKKYNNKKISPSIKARICGKVSMHLRVFLVTNLFRNQEEGTCKAG
jgi:hypothetical protein